MSRETMSCETTNRETTNRETPNRETMNRETTNCLVHAARIVLATLREIFDEAAYARFLTRTQTASSAKAYAAFRAEFEEAKTRRPKCC
jgi:hypothetical protein